MRDEVRDKVKDKVGAENYRPVQIKPLTHVGLGFTIPATMRYRLTSLRMGVAFAVLALGTPWLCTAHAQSKTRAFTGS